MAHTTNPREGEQQRRQQQPGSQGAPRRTPRNERESRARDAGGGGQGQTTRSQSRTQVSSGWEDEDSLRSDRRAEIDETLASRGRETGEDEDLPAEEPGGRGPETGEDEDLPTGGAS
jgi:hypothetical protein